LGAWIGSVTEKKLRRRWKLWVVRGDDVATVMDSRLVPMVVAVPEAKFRILGLEDLSLPAIE
jgi:hypothetical protein